MSGNVGIIIDLIGRDGASPALLKMGASADKAAASVSKAESGILGFSKKATAALGALVTIDVGAHMVKEAAQFQSAMLRIQTQAGASAGEVKRMSSALLDLSGKVGTSPMKLASSLYHIESTGLRGAKALQAVTIAAEGTKVGGADLEETTNALTSAVVSGIKGVQSMSQAMGALNAIVGTGDMKLSDLNEAMGTGILKVAKQFGLSLTDVGAALADFGDNNIRGADAATMLRQAMMAMSKPVAGGAAQLADLGLKSSQLGKDMQKGGLNQALADLSTHLKDAGVTGNKVGQVLTNAFGKKAGPGISILLDDLSRVQIKMLEINAGSQRFNSDWDATKKTASFAFDSVKASVESLGISIGSRLLPLAQGFFSVIGAGANVISAIKGPLLDIGTVALASWAAFKLFSALPMIFSAVGGAIETAALKVMYFGDTVAAAGTTAAGGWKGLLGPIAAVATGIFAIVSIFHRSSSASKEAAEAAKAYTDVLKSGGGRSDLIDSITTQLTKNNVPEKINKLNDSLGSTMFHAKDFAAAIETSGKPLTTLRGQLEAVIEKDTALRKSMGATGPKAGGAANSRYAELGRQAASAKTLLADLNAQQGALSKAAAKELTDAKAFHMVASSIDNVAASSKVGSKVAGEYAAMVGITVDKNGIAAVSSDKLNAAINTVASAYDHATQTSAGFLNALDTFSKSAGTSSDRAVLIGATLKANAGDALNYASAMNAAATSNKQLGTDIASAAKGVTKGGESTGAFLRSIINLRTGTIQYRKTAAAPLISDLQSIQTSALNAAQATFQHNRAFESGKKAADDAVSGYRGVEDSLVRQLTKMGLTSQQAQRLTDKYLGVPKNVRTLIEQEGANPVVTVLNKIGRLLANLTGQPWDAKISVTADISPSAIRAENLLNNVRGSSAFRITNKSSQPGMAVGTQAAFGQATIPPNTRFTVGEAGWEGGVSDSQGRVSIFSNRDSKAMGFTAPVGYAKGTHKTYTVNGVQYASKLAADNAQHRLSSSALSSVVSAIAALLAAARNTQSSASDIRGAAYSLRSAAHDSSLTNRAYAQIAANAAHRDSINARLGTAPSGTTAYDQLSSAKSAYYDNYSSVKTATSAFDITNMGIPAQVYSDKPAQAASAGSILSAFTAAASKARTYAGVLKKLVREGMPRDIVMQLAAAGPGALDQATALAAATPAQIAQFKAQDSILNLAGQAGGKTVADAYYLSGVRSAQGLVNGLLSQRNALNRAISKLADGMVSTLKHKLKIHSPSQVMFWHGSMTGEGFRWGVESKLDAIGQAGSKIGDSVRPPAAGSSVFGGRPLEFHVHGIEDPQEFVRRVKRKVVQEAQGFF